MTNKRKLWRDNTTPPINYIWLKTDLNNNLIGIYKYKDNEWQEVTLEYFAENGYSKEDIDEIARELNNKTSKSYVDTQISDTKSSLIRNIRTLREAYSRLNNSAFKYSVVSQDEYDTLSSNNNINEDTFYFIYEE